MSLNAQTFVFVGDTEIGAKLTAHLTAAGFEPAAGLSDADAVFTYYETQSGLEDVYLGDGGLLSETKEDVLLIDMSPTTPTFAKELFAIGRVSERHVVDAPLVVGDVTREDAFGTPSNLMMFVGAESETFDVVEPMLRAIAHQVEYMGNPGAGQTAKVAATLQDAAGIAALIEAYTSLINADEHLDFDEYLDGLQGVGAIAPKHVAVFEAVRARRFVGSYTLQILMAELGAALTAMDDLDIILPQAEACFYLLELLALVGGNEYNPAALSLAYADEETCNQFGIDWSRAEDAFGEDEHECCGGHHHDGDHECCGGHHHHHHHHHEGPDSFPEGYMGFSEN